MQIRPAETRDIPQILNLLHQVNMVHHAIRPDIFKPDTTKYDEAALVMLLHDAAKPVFVYEEGEVLGYAFCQVSETRDDLLLEDRKTLYIDDLCVDAAARNHHIGKALFDYVCRYARSLGCQSLTLNVWAGNTAALAFYQHQGMHILKTTMETCL